MIFADAHVHIYDCFDISLFLDSAVSNFTHAAAQSGVRGPYSSMLLLTEGARENRFQYLSQFASVQSTGKPDAAAGWTFSLTEEEYSLHARSVRGQSLFLIAGRQIATAENLEVLALATEAKIEDGATLEETVHRVSEAGAVPVIPWGTGKWMGRRGKTLKRFLEKGSAQTLFLGDNGGRPVFWPRPSLFHVAGTKGTRVLPGSDPLPFASEHSKPGRFGFYLDHSVSHERPGGGLKQLLMDPATRIHEYGRLETPCRFLRNQLAMQVLKRRRKK